MYMDLRHKNIMLIHSLKRQINTELRENPIRANSDQYSNNFRPVFDQRVYKHTLSTDADTRQRTSSTSEITSFFSSPNYVVVSRCGYPWSTVLPNTDP